MDKIINVDLLKEKGFESFNGKKVKGKIYSRKSETSPALTLIIKTKEDEKTLDSAWVNNRYNVFNKMEQIESMKKALEELENIVKECGE